MSTRSLAQLRRLTDDLVLPGPPAAPIDEDTSEVDFPPPEYSPEDRLDSGAGTFFPTPVAPMEDQTSAVSFPKLELPALDREAESAKAPRAERKKGRTDVARNVVSLISSAFEGLPIPVLKDLFRETIPLDFDAGEVLFAEGEVTGPAYILSAGKLQVEGAACSVVYDRSGVVVGLRSCALSLPRDVTVRALVASEVLALPPARLRLLMKKHGAIRRAVDQRLSASTSAPG